ncbi:MAG TPA: hypothetical protein VFM25_09695 [Verrucomicrobiae bacterium]|nr:hypothetical protein [Verrucomicrobiae bacterium]
MIPQEILKKIRQIELWTNRIVTDSLAAFSFQPPAQFRRIPRAVKNGNDRKNTVLNCEINHVAFEPTETNFLRATTNFLKKFRIGQCTLKRRFYFQFEFFAKAGLRIFIPGNSLIEFKARSGFENDWQAHRQPKRLLRSASTCSHGIPSYGFFSNSASRRSNSAVCSGVKSGSNPSSMRSSLSFCANSIRSASGRAFAALNNSVALMALNLIGQKHFASA